MDDARLLSAIIDQELAKTLDEVQTLADSPTLDHPGAHPGFAELAARTLADHPLWRDVILIDPKTNTRVFETAARFPPKWVRFGDEEARQQRMRWKWARTLHQAHGPGAQVDASALLPELRGDILGQAPDLSVGGCDLLAGHAPALHPVLDGLTLGEIEPFFVDESALVLEAGHACAP